MNGRDRSESLGLVVASLAVALCVLAAWRASADRRASATKHPRTAATVFDLGFSKPTCQKGAFCTIFHPLQQSLDHVTTFDDGTGALWTNDRTAKIVLVSRAGLGELEPPEVPQVDALAGTRADDVWIGTKGGGLFHFDGVTWSPVQLDADTPVTELFTTTSGDLIARADGKIFRVRNGVVRDLSRGLPPQEETHERILNDEGATLNARKFSYALFVGDDRPTFAFASTTAALKDTRVFRFEGEAWKKLAVTWPSTADAGDDDDDAPDVTYYGQDTPRAFYDASTDELVVIEPARWREVRVANDGRARQVAIGAEVAGEDTGREPDAGPRTEPSLESVAAFVDPRGRCLVDRRGVLRRRSPKGYERLAALPEPGLDAGAPSGHEGKKPQGILAATCNGRGTLLRAPDRLWWFENERWHGSSDAIFQLPRYVRGTYGKTPWFGMNRGYAFADGDTIGPIIGESWPQPIQGTPDFSGFSHADARTAIRLQRDRPVIFEPPEPGMTPIRSESADVLWWTMTAWLPDLKGSELLASTVDGTIVNRIPAPKKRPREAIVFPGPIAFTLPQNASDVVERFEGGTWGTVALPNAYRYRYLSGSAANDLWVIGEGEVAHFDGTRWSAIPVRTGEEGILYEIQPVGPNRALVLGQLALFEVDAAKGTAESVFETGSSGLANYTSLWSDGKTDWLAGAGGILRRER